MNRILVTVVLVVASSLSMTSSDAAVKAGAKCTKQGSSISLNGKKFTCVKSGKKFMWNKGVAINVPSQITVIVDPMPTPPPTLPDPLTPVEMSPLIGMTELSAQSYAHEKGWPYRVGERDGQFFPVTMDYCPTRVTFSITNGLIYKVMVG